MIRIEGERVTLREICEEDSELVVRWRNAERAARVFLTNPLLTLETQRRWLRTYQDDPRDITFIVEFEGRPVGMAALYHISGETAEFGRLLIGEMHLRKHGLARDAWKTALDYAFGTIGLRNVYVHIFEDNTPIVNLCRSLGYELEKSEVNGEGRAVLRMSITRTRHEMVHGAR